MSVTTNRTLPIGAELTDGGARFRVWAPDHQTLLLALDSETVAMERDADGYFSAEVSGLGAGARYSFELPSGERLADPASRCQPEGLKGPSEIVDPGAFAWSDKGWRGPGPDPVYYEMHIGTFTPEGTFAAAEQKLGWLKELGVTVIELMPVNSFAGDFGWGYDGVLLFAPQASYGTPDDMRRLVDAAHRAGIAVILDVVYNHFGPGEINPLFAQAYYSQDGGNEWGKGINFDGPDAGPVREFFLANAAYWIDEFHLDGLRIDATQALNDKSEDHIVAALARAARQAAGDRTILLTSENEPQEASQVRPPDQGGYGLDALWNDDFHHSARVALTGRTEAYFHDHQGEAQEFVSAAKYGYLYQGQRADWQDSQRGQAGFDLTPANFVHFIQNHDQIANTPGSRRVSQVARPAQMRAMTALLLLGPQAPLLFHGQEFGATTRFHYFSHQEGDAARALWEGRKKSLVQFPSFDDPDAMEAVPSPSERSTFEASKLDWTEAERNGEVLALHRDLLALRRDTPALQRARLARTVDGAVLGPYAFLLRFFGETAADDRLLVVNFGNDRKFTTLPEPLFAPPDGRQWRVALSSEDARYGGTGQRRIDVNEPWILTASTALWFEPERRERKKPVPKDDMDKWQESRRDL